MPSIICNDLCKTYRQGDATIKALDHVTLEIEPGSFICLSGPSGSGKTTLLNMIGGLDELDSGEIQIDGQRVDQLSKGPLADLRLHHIGFVFQAYNLSPTSPRMPSARSRRSRAATPCSSITNSTFSRAESTGIRL